MNLINKIDIKTDIWGAPDGVAALAVLKIATAGKPFIFVSRDDARMASLRDFIVEAAPHITALTLPAWDCLPFDRLSPQGGLVGRRVETMAQLAAGSVTGPVVLFTTVNAVLQRVPPKSYFANRSLVIVPGVPSAPASLH